MATFSKSAKAALARGRDNVSTAGRIAKSATKAAATAGVSAAVLAGAAEIGRGIRDAKTAPKRRRLKVAAAIAGVAALAATGIAVARARKAKAKKTK